MKKTQSHAGIRLDQFANVLGHINDKKLLALLYPSTKIPRTKLDLNPTAQSKTPCAVYTTPDMAMSVLFSKLDLIKSKDRLLFFIAHLQLVGGLRISEVLAIQPCDISNAGHVNIRSLKNSADSVIHGGEAAQYLINCKLNSVVPFSLYNRFYVYRQYKKFGINYTSMNSSKMSVTHAFRHINAETQASAHFDQDTVQKFLRHKSPKSTEYYGNNKKRFSKA